MLTGWRSDVRSIHYHYYCHRLVGKRFLFDLFHLILFIYYVLSLHCSCSLLVISSKWVVFFPFFVQFSVPSIWIAHVFALKNCSFVSVIGNGFLFTFRHIKINDGPLNVFFKCRPIVTIGIGHCADCVLNLLSAFGLCVFVDCRLFSLKRSSNSFQHVYLFFLSFYFNSIFYFYNIISSARRIHRWSINCFCVSFRSSNYAMQPKTKRKANKIWSENSKRLSRICDRRVSWMEPQVLAWNKLTQAPIETIKIINLNS